MKGMRVQSIIRELHGEKIDIIEYHEDPVTFAEKALQPAKGACHHLEGHEKHWKSSSTYSQLSLAIGKKGKTFVWPPAAGGRSTSRARKETPGVEEQMPGRV